jgi:hypothetical protein
MVVATVPKFSFALLLFFLLSFLFVYSDFLEFRVPFLDVLLDVTSLLEGESESATRANLSLSCLATVVFTFDLRLLDSFPLEVKFKPLSLRFDLFLFVLTFVCSVVAPVVLPLLSLTPAAVESCEFCSHDGTTVITDCFFDRDDLPKLGKCLPDWMRGGEGTEGTEGATLLDLGVLGGADFEQVHCKTSFHWVELAVLLLVDGSDELPKAGKSESMDNRAGRILMLGPDTRVVTVPFGS